MAYEFYVTIEATKQGRLAGESTRDVHKGKLPGIGFSYEVKSPRDAATGQASGKRQHGPITFTKLTNASVTSIHQYVAAQEDADLDNAELEDVALTFHAIEITNVDAKTTASDSIVGGQ